MKLFPENSFCKFPDLEIETVMKYYLNHLSHSQGFLFFRI